MIERIVSGGQTGVDRAALDVAIARGIPCGGWCPQGRLAEDGVIPACYPLRETPSAQYEERTVWNVRDSDGTLVLTCGPPSEGTAFTIYTARQYAKPCLVIDLSPGTTPKLSLGVARCWIAQHDVRTLNVAGPRASKHDGIYQLATTFLHQLLTPSSSPLLRGS